MLQTKINFNKNNYGWFETCISTTQNSGSQSLCFESSEKKFLSVKLEVLSEVLFVRFCKQRIHGYKNSVHCLVGLTGAVCVFKTYLIAHYFKALRKQLLLGQPKLSMETRARSTSPFLNPRITKYLTCLSITLKIRFCTIGVNLKFLIYPLTP